MGGETVIVAMSGGVDSSVAAYLLQQQGYRPVGLFIDAGAASLSRQGPTAGGREARSAGPGHGPDAVRRVADHLGIGLEVLDLSADFDRLIAYVCAEYGRGRTPNPCARCNREIKFARLFERADALGAALVATGHYARAEWEAGRWRLKRALDRAKDQSYFLFGIAPALLERVRLPLGEMNKPEVRRLARDLDLPSREAPESQDVCFVAGHVSDLVRRRRPDLVRSGPILDTHGRELGRHGGIVNFTIGQRRGLGVAVGRPQYVVAIRPEDDAVIVGPKEAARSSGLLAEGVVWHERPPAEPVRAKVQIRHRHCAAPAWITRLETAGEPGRAEVRFDQPQSAVTPGQAAVFYRDDRVMGGGWIAETTSDPPPHPPS